MTSTADRRIEILKCLIYRKHDTMENLALEFGVSRMTIYRDIQVLSCSHPIITNVGGAGGVSIDKDYTLGRKYMTDEQRSLLLKLSETLCGEDGQIIQSILKTFSKPQP